MLPGVFHGVVQVDEANAPIDQFLYLLHVFGLDDRVAAAAIHEEDDRFGILEGLRVFRPAVAGHDRKDAWRLLEQFHQQGAAREELVFSRPVTLVTRDQDDLGEGGICRLRLERHFRLVETVFVCRPNAQSRARQSQQQRSRHARCGPFA